MHSLYLFMLSLQISGHYGKLEMYFEQVPMSKKTYDNI